MVDFEITPRGEVGLAPPRGGLSPFQYVDGIVVHYVGGNPMALNPTDAQSRATCRNIQHEAFNNTNEGYIDIQYNHLLDPVGRCYEGRGFSYKSGANGSSNYNGHALAICVLLGVHQPLPQAAFSALVAYGHEARSRYHMISYVWPHSRVAPFGTACPGDITPSVPELERWILSGMSPEPAPQPKPKEIEMVIIKASGKPYAIGQPGQFREITEPTADAFRDAGVKIVNVAVPDYDRLT